MLLTEKLKTVLPVKLLRLLKNYSLRIAALLLVLTPLTALASFIVYMGDYLITTHDRVGWYIVIGGMTIMTVVTVHIFRGGFHD